LAAAAAAAAAAQVACLVATEILALVGLRSFRTAALLLVGLLAYDVFWVFGSPAGEEREQYMAAKQQYMTVNV
jgi:hypothetical protein